MSNLDSLAVLPMPEHETEASMVADWLRASTSSLLQVWDNEEDAVYDQPERADQRAG